MGQGGEAGPSRGVAAAALLVLMAMPPTAGAQSTLLGERGTLLVPGGETVPARNFTLGFVGDAGPKGFAAAPLGLTLGLTSRVEAGLAFLAWPAGDPQARGADRDLRLAVKSRLWDQGERRPGAALGLSADHLARGVDLVLSLSLHKDLGPLVLAGQAGWRRPGRRDAADPAEASYGVGAAWYFTRSATVLLAGTGATGANHPKLSVMPGFAWSLLGPDPMAARREALRAQGLKARAEAEAALGGLLPAAPAENALPGPGGNLSVGAPAWSTGLLAARAPALAQPGRVTIFLTGGPSFGGPETFRVFFGVELSSFDELLQDSDGDGIPDRFDKCPFEPEDHDGFEDEDGCPDHGADHFHKLIEERARAAKQARPRFTTDTPRFRLAVPLGKVPDPGAAGRPAATMYAPTPTPEPTPEPTPPASRPPVRAPAPPAHVPPAPPAPAPPAPAPKRPAPLSAPAPVTDPVPAPARTAAAAPLPARAPAPEPLPGLRPQHERDAPRDLVDRTLPPPVGVIVLTPSAIERRLPALPTSGDRSGRPPGARPLADGAAGRTAIAIVKGSRPVGEPDWASAGETPTLEGSATGLRQLKQALTRHRAEFEGCLASVGRGVLTIAQVTIDLIVGPDGHVDDLSVSSEPPVSRDDLACLGQVSSTWRLPISDAGYFAAVAITVFRKGLP